MQPTSTNGLEDMAALIDLHEGAIMHNLFQRYQLNKIYVSVWEGGKGNKMNSGNMLYMR